MHRTCDPLARGDVLHPKNTALLFKLLVELEDPIMPSARAIKRVRALISDRVHSINAQHNRAYFGARVRACVGDYEQAKPASRGNPPRARHGLLEPFLH